MYSEREREMYVELLKKVILFEIWQDHEQDLYAGFVNKNTTVNTRNIEWEKSGQKLLIV